MALMKGWHIPGNMTERASRWFPTDPRTSARRRERERLMWEQNDYPSAKERARRDAKFKRNTNKGMKSGS